MSAIASYRALLSNGPLTRLFVGEFVSGVGNWLYLVALMVIVYRASGDPVLLGIVGAARILPYVIFSIPAGYIADRFDRRYVLLSSDLVRGVLMLVLTWLAMVDGSPWAMLVVAILATCFATLFYPAIGAIIPSLVRDESEFGPANSLWQTLDMVAFIIGPAVGGLLIAASDLTTAFFLNAISFFLVAVVVWRLPAKAGHAHRVAAEGAEASVSTAIVEVEATDVSQPTGASGESPASAPAVSQAAPSWRGIPRRAVAGVFAIDLTGSFVAQALFVLVVLLATDVYASGDAAVGYLNAAIGIGGVVGAIGAGVLVLRRSLAPALLVGALGAAGSIAVLGLTHDLRVAFALFIVYAAAGVAIDVADTTVFQRIVPDELRGRASGVWLTVTMLFQVFGAMAGPILYGTLGLMPLMVGLAAVLALGGIGAVLLIGPAAVREPTEFELELVRAARLPVFAGLPPAKLDHALRRLTPVKYAAGDVIIRQGDPADRFYILGSGHVAVTATEGPAAEARFLRRLGQDDVFGEIGLLTNAPRTATVTAEDDVLVFAMAGQEFLRLVASGPGAINRFLDLYRSPAPTPAPAEPMAAIA